MEQWELHKLDEAYTCSVSCGDIPKITIKQDDETASEGNCLFGLVDFIVAHLESPIGDVIEMDCVDTVLEDSVKKEQDSGQTTPTLENSTTCHDKLTFHHQGLRRSQRSTPYIHPSFYAQRMNARNRTRRAQEEAETLADLLSSLGGFMPLLHFSPRG